MTFDIRGTDTVTTRRQNPVCVSPLLEIGSLVEFPFGWFSLELLIQGVR